MSRGTLRVSEIGEFVRHGSCERRFKLSANNRALARRLPFSERLFNTIDPVLQEAGRRREDEWDADLKARGFQRLQPDLRVVDWTAFVDEVGGVGPESCAFAREVEVAGTIGAFDVQGRIDFLLVRVGDGGVDLRIVECKASRRDHTYHRIQLATYTLLVEQMIAKRPLPQGISDVEAVVARLDEDTNAGQAIPDVAAMNLTNERGDVIRLLRRGGPLDELVRAELDDVEYLLGPGCDGCVFNVDCLPESARQRRLELLALDPPTVRRLGEHGVQTIDDLASLDVSSGTGAALAGDVQLSQSAARLIRRAQARLTTLPGESERGTYEVMHYGWTQSQLPDHADGALIRIYLSVSYDYVENRIGALAAHVTRSRARLITPWSSDGPEPGVLEEREIGGRRERTAPSGVSVVALQERPWSGDLNTDDDAERDLLNDFLMELIEAIEAVAHPTDEAPLHFYVWSRGEIAQLTEACSRVGTDLLAALHELLGCRESLEQPIYSSLQEEVDRRYAIGWTGRALTVVTSLRWYGDEFHWTRMIDGERTALDEELQQDLFDFKTDLMLTEAGDWSDSKGETFPFEIRSRWYDTLTAPYWRALWSTLPDPGEVDDRLIAASIIRYNRAARPGVLRGYLEARTHAMRWLDERIRFKNKELSKPPVNIHGLRSFSLGVDSTQRSALDFLRLDQHVRMTDWIGRGLTDVQSRCSDGRTVPLRELQIGAKKGSFTALINAEEYHLELDALRERTSFGEGAFVRVSPASLDPNRGQSPAQLTRAGATCRVAEIDWETGEVGLDVVWQREADRYLLRSSGGGEPGDPVFERATMDESPSDYVSRRVDARLTSFPAAAAYGWFNPLSPSIPDQFISDADLHEACRDIVESFISPEGYGLNEGQRAACFAGLETRVQLLLGPPGTGKTETTAVSLLLRVFARRFEGDVVLVGAHTHTAVNEVLNRLVEVADAFERAANQTGFPATPVTFAKVDPRAEDPLRESVHRIASRSSVTAVNTLRKRAVLVIGGTTGGLLKLAETLEKASSFRTHRELGLQVPTLVVDEASMMIFPHFLALATLVAPDGEIMLAGDHRQLSPIVAHDWDDEDRPPVQLYRPFVSAYEAVRSIVSDDQIEVEQAMQSELTFTHRLPPDVRALVGTLYQRLDDVELDGRSDSVPTTVLDGTVWEQVMHGGNGLYLITHGERRSSNANECEAEIIDALLHVADVDPNTIAVVTPHRAQRALLRSRLAAHHASIRVVDTVEKVQGVGVETVFVSACVSDPSVIRSRAEFILNLNRANVAFSRSKRRLVVVVAETLLDAIPAEFDVYQSAMLWKTLRELCQREVGQVSMGATPVRAATAR